MCYKRPKRGSLLLRSILYCPNLPIAEHEAFVLFLAAKYASQVHVHESEELFLLTWGNVL